MVNTMNLMVSTITWWTNDDEDKRDNDEADGSKENDDNDKWDLERVWKCDNGANYTNDHKKNDKMIIFFFLQKNKFVKNISSI